MNYFKAFIFASQMLHPQIYTQFAVIAKNTFVSLALLVFVIFTFQETIRLVCDLSNTNGFFLDTPMNQADDESASDEDGLSKVLFDTNTPVLIAIHRRKLENRIVDFRLPSKPHCGIFAPPPEA